MFRQITPLGVVHRQHHFVFSAQSTPHMNSEGIARVERLVTWIKKHRKDLLALDGDISPTQLAAATGKKVTYWSDVLRLSKESFGASSARLTEDALDMPRLHFDGGISEPSPRRGVALDVSQHSGIIFPTTTVAWEDVLADLPKEFLLRIEDDAMAPDVRAGQTVLQLRLQYRILSRSFSARRRASLACSPMRRT